MAFNPKLLTEDEEVVREFRPHWRLLFLPLMWVAVGAIAIGLSYYFIDNSTVNLVVTAAILIALIPLAVHRFIKWWFTSYVLTNERLITRSGVVARSGIEIPLENITNVLFTQNVVERILKSGDLLVESAGTSGQSRFADIPQPDAFQALLYKTREQRAMQLEGGRATPTPAHPTESLERLAKLHRDGVISDEEFAAKRQGLLDQM